jgi:hypothetical protein
VEAAGLLHCQHLTRCLGCQSKTCQRQRRERRAAARSRNRSRRRRRRGRSICSFGSSCGRSTAPWGAKSEVRFSAPPLASLAGAARGAPHHPTSPAPHQTLAAARDTRSCPLGGRSGALEAGFAPANDVLLAAAWEGPSAIRSVPLLCSPSPSSVLGLGLG